MKTGTFIVETDKDRKITIPAEVIDRLEIKPGDKFEIMLKKIRVRRLDVNIAKNPLFKILDLATSKRETPK